MRTFFFSCLLSLLPPMALLGDELRIGIRGQPVLEFSDADEIDWLRSHLVFVFDTANHHCQEDSESPWKPTQKEIADLIDGVKEGDHLEMTFETPAPIRVESRTFLIQRLWVRIRESDWATFDWTFETPEGEYVALSRVEGTYNRRLGPIIRAFVEEPEGE